LALFWLLKLKPGSRGYQAIWPEIANADLFRRWQADANKNHHKRRNCLMVGHNAKQIQISKCKKKNDRGKLKNG